MGGCGVSELRVLTDELRWVGRRGPGQAGGQSSPTPSEARAARGGERAPEIGCGSSR